MMYGPETKRVYKRMASKQAVVNKFPAKAATWKFRRGKGCWYECLYIASKIEGNFQLRTASNQQYIGIRSILKRH